MIILLLLCACSKGEASGSEAEQLALEIRGEYLAATGWQAECSVTADYGQRVYAFTFTAAAAGGESVVTVTAPENVAGLTARLRDGESTLEYGEIVLETGRLGDDLAPVGALPLLVETACGGFIDVCALEEQDGQTLLRVDCREAHNDPGTGQEVTLWFDAAAHTLVRGEVAQDGVRVLTCVFASFALAGG